MVDELRRMPDAAVRIRPKIGRAVQRLGRIREGAPMSWAPGAGAAWRDSVFM